MLPAKDPNILLSIVNMKLRDVYASLDDYCDDCDVDREELLNVLQKAGWTYNPQTNSFVK